MAAKQLEQETKQKLLADLMRKQNEIRNMLDTRANIIIGFDSVLILFVISNYHDNLAKNIAFSVALVALFISLFCAILALKPPKFLSKKGQKESIFYHDYIASKGFSEYSEEVYDVLSDEQSAFDAYITEAYNLTKYSNAPKKFYTHLSIRVLIYGILLAIVVYAVTLFL